ncbi:HAD family hydrolase [Candidatus Uhrbacteria bacterium]|nr:HAD family hydrolase [Candidatus Uhrbacteria bacterium]
MDTSGERIASWTEPHDRKEAAMVAPTPHLTTLRVGAVGFDATHTLLEAVASRPALEAKILKDVSGIDVDPDTLWTFITELKRQHPRSGRDMDEYWPPLNRMLLEHVGASGDLDRMALRMHEQHYDDASLYCVRDDMRELLEWAAPLVSLVVLSNQQQGRLIGLLRHHDVLRYFENGGRGTRVYTSGHIKHSKPSREYLRAVARKLRLKSVRELILVGNSLENDAQAAKLGVRTAILDRSGLLNRVPVTLPGVTPVDSPAAIRSWIERLCGFVAEQPSDRGGNGVPEPEVGLAAEEDLPVDEPEPDDQSDVVPPNGDRTTDEG